MHKPLSAHTRFGMSAQYNEKPSQLQSSVFSTVPIILPIQMPTLSPSVLTTDIPIIMSSTEPRRDTT